MGALSRSPDPDPSPSLLARTEAFVRARLESRACGHDWWHIHRVRALASRIAGEIGADPLVVEMAALLHDVADPKLDAYPGEGQALLREYLDALEKTPAPGLEALPEGFRARLEGVLERGP